MNPTDPNPPRTHGCGSSARTKLPGKDEEKLRSPSPSSQTNVSTHEYASQKEEMNHDCELGGDLTRALAEHEKVSISISEDENKDRISSHANESHINTMLPSNPSERLTSIKPTNKTTRRKRPLEGISDEEVVLNHFSQGPNSSFQAFPIKETQASTA
ncbi:hypothetical protein V2G26_006430 [Clonostachys chloroleuca]